MLEGIGEYAALKELSSAIKEKAKEYKEKLTQLKQILADWGWNDKVSDLYRSIFQGGRIVQHDLSKEEIRADLTRRITHRIPPGYKDGGKQDEGVGDLIIWHSLIKLANSMGKPVIFVCNEEKADWLVRSNEETLMPRPELTHGFYQATGRHFAIMSWPRFLKAMHAKPITVHEAELARASDTGAFPALEKRIDKILMGISSILKDFTRSWSAGLEAMSCKGKPYIDADQFKHFIKVFESALIDYERSAPESEGRQYLKNALSWLRAIEDDNVSLMYNHMIDAPINEPVIDRMIHRCNSFEEARQAFRKWCRTQALKSV